MGRHPGEGFGNRSGRGDGVAAETVHQAGQHRNGRLIAIHQDVLPFAHILQQGRGYGGHIKGKEFVGIKPLPFGGPVDGQDFAFSGLPQPVVGELLAQGIDFGAGSHGGLSLIKNSQIYQSGSFFIANLKHLGKYYSLDSENYPS